MELIVAINAFVLLVIFTALFLNYFGWLDKAATKKLSKKKPHRIIKQFSQRTVKK